MEKLPGAIDAVVKAPLWVFFALALSATIPLLPISSLVAIGMTPNIKILNLPVAVFAILFWCLFATSVIARVFSKAAGHFGTLFRNSRSLAKYRSLSPQAQLILLAFEENNIDSIKLRVNWAAVTELRDLNLIEYRYRCQMDTMVAVHEQTFQFVSDMIYHKSDLRKLFRAKVAGNNEFLVELFNIQALI